MDLPEQLVKYRRIPLLGRLCNALLRLLGINIPAQVNIGNALALPHGAVGLVVHERTTIGNDVKLYQGVTLGRRDTHLRNPKPGGEIVIQDNVVIGAGAKVLFAAGQTLIIGRGAVIGANAVVLKSVPPGEIWAGLPARRVGMVTPAQDTPEPVESNTVSPE